MHIKNKDFKVQYMHPTRRKLANMIHTGEYEADVKIGYREAVHVRNVGDEWVDSNGDTWRQMDFGKVKISAMSDIMKDVRKYLHESTTCVDRKNGVCDCKQRMSHADKKLISKTGFCATALAKRETIIKLDGLWDAYETYRITSNQIAHANDILEKFREAYDTVKQEYEVVHKDGRLDKWTMDVPVEQVKAEILDNINRVESELSLVIQKRNDAWERLKDKNYELVAAPVDNE